MPNPADPFDPTEKVPIIGGVTAIPVTRVTPDGAVDMFILDFYVGAHVISATRQRQAIRRTAIPTLIGLLNSLEWGSDITEWDPQHVRKAQGSPSLPTTLEAQ